MKRRRSPENPGAAGVFHAGMLPDAELAGYPVRNVGALVDLALRLGKRQLYVLPSSVEAMGLPRELPPRPSSELAMEGLDHPFVRGAWETHGTRPGGLGPWMVAWPRIGADQMVDLAFPAYDRISGLAAARTPAELLGAVLLFSRLLGIPYRWSPGATGAALIRHVHRRGNATALESSEEPVPPAAVGGTETDLRWLRPLDMEEAARPWAHAFDLNGQYLAAASTIELGFGAAEHVIPLRGDGISFPRPAPPGYWMAELAGRKAAGGTLPDPFDPAGRGPRRLRWYATPTMELAAELGVVRRVEQAFSFPRHHRFLGPWYERLRNARAELMASHAAGAGLALGMVKRTYAVTIGYLGARFHDSGSPLHRPDWRHAVIARARANLWRRLAKIPPHLRPFAVDVDCVFMASEHASPQLAAEAAGLPLGDGLGAFKVAGSAPLPAVQEALGDGARPFAALREAVR